MRNYKYLIVLLMTLLAISVTAQLRGQRGHRPPRHRNEQRPPAETVDSAFAAKFEAQSQNLRGLDMKYRVASISDVKDNPILVIYLHGHSASGNDNLKPLAKKGVRSIYDYLEKNGIAAYLLVPQCPDNRRWNERETNGWQMTNVVKEIVDEFVKTHGINTKKIFIFGDSMGGAGVFRMLNDYNNFFAAAMIAASVPRGVSAGKISKTPLCYVVGSEDDVVICDETMKMINDLQKKKVDMRYELMQGKTHPETCRDAFTDENIEWVLNHTREHFI